jgi:hypothetical protein
MAAEPGSKVASKDPWLVRPLWIGGICLVVVMCVAGCLLGLREVSGVGPTRRKAQHLLAAADHAKVLAECRALLANKNVAKDVPLASLSAYIGSLGPSYVVVSEGDVDVEFGGGFHHYGFRAFAAGKEPALESDDMNNRRQVIPGLWFCEEKGSCAVLERK